MIVLPACLKGLLREVDEARAAILALDFAEHAVGFQANALDGKRIDRAARWQLLRVITTEPNPQAADAEL